MGDDWLLRSVDHVEEAGRATIAGVEALIASLEPLRQQRGAGVPLAGIADDLIARGGPAVRRRCGEALAEYARAVMLFRARMIRAMVDTEGMSLSEVSRKLGVSRQMVTRLYRAAEES